MTNIFGKNLHQLMVETIDDLSTTSNITNFSPGSITRALLSTVNKQTEKAYATFDINFARAFLSGAAGKYIDFLGDIVGLSRLGSTRNSSVAAEKNIKFFVETGTFGDINNNQSISIPPNTQIKTHKDSPISYITTSTNILLADASEAFISVSSISTGQRSNVAENTLKYHNFTGYVDASNNSLKVTNAKSILAARDLETDTNYKFRIASALLSAEKANTTALRLASLSVPGIADVLVFPRLYGIGTTDIVIQSVFPSVSTSLINSVKSAITDVEAVGSLTTVRGPKEYGIGMTVELTTRSKLDTTQQDNLGRIVDTVIIDKVNQLNIGDELVLSSIIQTILATNDLIKNVGTLQRPFQELSLYVPTVLEDNKRREELLDDFQPPIDGRVIIEPSLSDPIQVVFV